MLCWLIMAIERGEEWYVVGCVVVAVVGVEVEL
jgi:hypothetical protein